MHCDRARIELALSNLIDNAIKFTPSGGQVTVRVEREGKLVRLSVRDTGCGIEPADRPHIFERFYLGSGVGNSNIPGIGLGLSIVKEIVDLHGGDIEVESEVGEGSTFRVWLPLEKGKGKNCASSDSDLAERT